MATLDELLAAAEVEKETFEHRLRKLMIEHKGIIEQAGAEGRSALTKAEDDRIEEIIASREQVKRDLQGVAGKLANLHAIKAEESEIARGEKDSTPVEPGRLPEQRTTSPAVVTRGERTYNKGNDRRGKAFLADVVRAQLFHDVAASTRLAQHMHEEVIERGEQLLSRGGMQQRAIGTGAFTGLTVPQYLTDMYAPATAAMRPFADACNHHDLPADGMTINISRITTPTGAALQATQNTAVQENNSADTLLTVNVQTIAGQQTLSRQAIDRGTGIEDVVIDDLMRRYASALDSTLINQATTGLSAVATAVSYVDASPTGPKMYPKILNAQANVDAALLGFGSPDLVVMHTRRWAWLQSQVSATWPMFTQPGIPGENYGAANPNGPTRYGSGYRGIFPNGMAVITDNNIATTLGGGTEDEIYVVPSAECHLWEDPAAPVFIRAEQAAAANLGVLLVLYGYVAYTFGRYTNGMGKVSGSGLAAPTF